MLVSNTLFHALAIIDMENKDISNSKLDNVL